MSRQEDFKRMAHSHDTESSKYEQECYVDGAEDGYQYAIDKACEWLADRVAHDSIDYPMATVHLIDDFRKAMQ